MTILHLGGSGLGQRIREVLRDSEPDLIVADDPDELSAATDSMAQGQLEWIVCSGYRWILTDKVLGLANDSCNVHTSFLPWGRGAHPNVWAIVDREPAGVSLHRMVRRVDAGPVFAQREVSTSFADTGKDLYERLEDAAVALFAQTWPSIRRGECEARPQPAGGSHHRASDLDALRHIDLGASVTWQRALDVLRALTFPPYRNVVVELGGRSYHVEVSITDVTPEES